MDENASVALRLQYMMSGLVKVALWRRYELYGNF